MPRLVFRNGDGAGVFELEDARIEIGRHARNAIVINHPCISNRHARLERTSEGEYELVDLNSDNGTFLNNRAVTRSLVRHGDTLRFGLCEADFEEADWDEDLVEGESTQRITLEGLAQENAEFWTATVENKRRELETLERQIETLRASPTKEPAPTEEPPEDLTALRSERKELQEDIARLESRRQEMQDSILRTDAELRQLKDQDLPASQSKLEELRSKITRSHQELRELKAQIEDAREKLQSMSGLREEIGSLKRQIESLETRQREKQSALEAVAADLQAEREKLESARKGLADANEQREAYLDQAAQARDEHEDLLLRNRRAIEAIKKAESEITETQEEARHTHADLETLIARKAMVQKELRRAEQTLEVHQNKLKKGLSKWEEDEQAKIQELGATKQSLQDEIVDAEVKLDQVRQEAADLRASMESDKEEHKQELRDLKASEYEPARQLCESLGLRNEELAREISQQERFLEQLKRAIEEGKATERIVSDSLAAKGKELDRLENRIGEEVERITAEVKRSHVPVSNTMPDVSEWQPIFSPKNPKPSSAPKLNQARPPRTCLVVLDPSSQIPPQDFADCQESDFLKSPLPVGFAGLAAATRGAFEVSLAATVERQQPVLYIPSGDLAESCVMVKKLRSALPTRILLLGWHAETFLTVSETLEQGTNFQDLAAMLGMVDGSITTDPYMNTFFDSLNETKRFLYIPPSLPWNPNAPREFAAREGLLLDSADFNPDHADHLTMAHEIQELCALETRPLTILNSTGGRTEAFLEALKLPLDTITLQARPEAYPDHLELLEAHLAQISLETVRFHSACLRDALLTRTLLIARTSEPTQIFFPEAFSGRGSRLLPAPNQIQSVLSNEETYERIRRLAERRLVEDYSYPATARMLDEFVATLR